MRDRFAVILAACLSMPGLSPAAMAEPPPPFECTLVTAVETGAVVNQQGACDRRLAPASTFKLPLALIGFEAGILLDAHDPAWDWRPGIEAPPRDRRTVDPEIWLKDSVLWYSRAIVARLGPEKFAAAVKKLGYGNADVTGGPTHAWLGASLEISAVEQVGFLRRLLAGNLPFSKDAQDKTRALTPVFDGAEGWSVHGKTGSGFLRDANGAIDRTRPFGWFVGWAEREGQRVVFARLRLENAPVAEPLGPRVRDEFLRDVPRFAVHR